MAERMREVVGKHSTWYVCDEHGWDFTNEEKDVCPVCYGESLSEERIIQLLEAECDCDFYEKYEIPSKCVAHRHISLIKGEK